MEARPTLAWILLLTAVAERPGTVQPRDFTAKDIVLLHPSTPPHPGAFKCFTCQDAPDNYDCNRWAPDLYCPQSARYCSALHTMDGGGASVSVTKRCATPRDCRRHTGCAVTAGGDHKACSSCCEGNICNLPVPRNESAAVFSPAAAAAGRAGPASGLRGATLPAVVFVSAIFTAV